MVVKGHGGKRTVRKPWLIGGFVVPYPHVSKIDTIGKPINDLEKKLYKYNMIYGGFHK